MMLQTDVERHSVFCKNTLHSDKIALKFMLFPILTARESSHYLACLNNIVDWQISYLSLHTTYRDEMLILKQYSKQQQKAMAKVLH